MPRRLLPLPPRPPREVGKRGQILLVFGLIWIGLGVGVLTEGEPAYYDQIVPFTWLPETVRAWLWIATGAVAVAYAWRPRIIAHDGLGFLALYLMPAYRCGAFLWGWLDSRLPLGGGPGGLGDLASALIYAAVVAAVMVCSSWPNPVPADRDNQ